MTKYPQEDHARALHAQLNRELASELPGTRASVSGEGVHWHCRAERQQRACTLHCFDNHNWPSRAEFLACFEENEAIPLWGRTSEQSDVVAAVCAWLEGRSTEALFIEFAFVERQRRALEKFEQEAIESQPRLAELPSREMVPSEGGDGCTLRFRTNDRSCEIGGYIYEDIAYAEFYWDECLQFSVQTEDATLARLLKRWLCDNAMPSAIQREYPSVALQSVAHYYEQGRGIEGEFIESWDHVEDFYKRIERPFASHVLKFIQQLRSAGYERTLRVGTSLFSLVVSRSRRYGLRSDQPYIGFSFGGARFNNRALADGEMEVAVCFDGFDEHERVSTFPRIELNADLNKLLEKLEEKAID